MPKINSRFGGGRMWGSISALETLASIAFWIGVTSGGVALIAGAALTITSDRIAALTKASADVRITEADARAEEAKRDAAEANARAEEAKAEAARANERVQKAQEMRHLTTSQAGALKSFFDSPIFQADPKPRIRVSTISDSEAESYALEFLNFFKSCGVKVYPTPGGTQPNEHFQLAEHPTGLSLGVKNEEQLKEGKPLGSFLKLAHSIGLFMTVEVNPSRAEEEGMLYVMRKPPC
ncbi:MAG: hypothetical protein OSA47_00695 [Novosphingopyxis baekryungensis]|jgi:hypothetical protein|nr:hypothetical protein [Novosphingopyxis baekryungensis]